MQTRDPKQYKLIIIISLLVLCLNQEMAQPWSDSSAAQLDINSHQKPVIIPIKEEWYYPPSGGRQRYYHCGKCAYKTKMRARLQLHHEKGCRLFEELPYGCSFCGFRSTNLKSIETHNEYHEIKSPHQCSICTYSALSQAPLTRHINRDHPLDFVAPSHIKVTTS